VALVSDANEIFDGTIEENITIGRDFVNYTDVVWALSITRLDEDMVQFSKGLKTELVSSGRNLSRGQIQRILIARAIVERPQLLILDEAFTGIDEHRKLQIMRDIFDRSNPWTVINISHDIQTVLECDSVNVLEDGLITESGCPVELIGKSTSRFAALFSHHLDWKESRGKLSR
jgi:ATP-binding cassette subfamily B protein